MSPRSSVLFLGYGSERTSIINAIMHRGCKTQHTADKISNLSGHDLIVSFGYRHIIKPPVLSTAECPIINMHVAYLPYNRGAEPNFWALFDGTPSGVTIHLIDEGVDTGDILFQKYVNFDGGERTFAQTKARLISEIEQLFLDNFETLLHGPLEPQKQRGFGSHHYLRETPKELAGWDSVIDDEIQRLDALGIPKSQLFDV